MTFETIVSVEEPPTTATVSPDPNANADPAIPVSNSTEQVRTSRFTMWTSPYLVKLLC
jgi:hypothetical protein